MSPKQDAKPQNTHQDLPSFTPPEVEYTPHSTAPTPNSAAWQSIIAPILATICTIAKELGLFHWLHKLVHGHAPPDEPIEKEKTP